MLYERKYLENCLYNFFDSYFNANFLLGELRRGPWNQIIGSISLSLRFILFTSSVEEFCGQ